MSRFTIYARQTGPGYLLDVQANMMSHLNTRVVVPLLPLAEAPKPAKTLNPQFVIDGAAYSMVTQYMAAVPSKVLKGAILSAEDRHDEIVAALDLLLQGF
jgi:toxin CcdB